MVAATYWSRNASAAAGPAPPTTALPATVTPLATAISTHAWSADNTLCAVCPNNNEINVYQVSGAKWELKSVLKEHTQLVSDLAWAPNSNQLLSVSHDRNAFVWKQKGATWEPVLVVLRLNRAALCGKWSPSENKFAIGSGAKSVCVCYYEPDNNWWISKHMKKKHASSVTDVAWHPNNILLATASTDNKCRIYSALIKHVDDPELANSTLAGVDPFGEILLEIDTALGWGHSVAWSPSGARLALVAQDSGVHTMQGLDGSAQGCQGKPVSSLLLSCMPFTVVVYLSETKLIAAGYDCSPVVFEADGSGEFKPTQILTAADAAEAGNKKATQFNAAFDMFKSQSEKGQSSEMGGSGDAGGPIGPHKNVITCIRPLGGGRFSTSGLDGKVIVWSL